MSKMTWFKLHSEFRNDPKIKRLPIAERYAFIILLCVANESETRGVISGLDDDDIAFELEMQVEDWKTLKAKFKVKGFIDFTQDEILIRNWDKRQYDKPSDHPEATKQRKRLQRERDKIAKDQDVTLCHADVTPMSRGRVEEIRSEEIRSEDLFFRAQEKKMNAPCKIEISLPEEKKETIALEENLKIQDPTPVVPAPQNMKFIDPYQRAMEVRQREPEVKKMMDDREFLKFLIPLMKRWDAYKTSCDSSDARKWVRVAIEPKNDKCDSRWDESRDRYQDFLDSQQQRSQQQSIPIAVQELTATAPPAHIRERFKTA